MAIFGNDVLLNGTVIHHATTLDKVLDHVFLVLSIALLIVSCVCNPLVFWYHWRKKQTTPAVMFQILTANDFLTCLVMVPVIVYYLTAAGVSFLNCELLTFRHVHFSKYYQQLLSSILRFLLYV